MKRVDDNYKYYIDGLKGAACLFIMIGHFLGIYKYSENFPEDIVALNRLLTSKFSFLLNEGWWLYLFFVVSGYLVGKSTVKTIKDLLVRCVKRILRFVLPISFSYFIIYIIYVTVGFHTVETRELLQCSWYQNFYAGNYSIKDFLLGAYSVLVKGNAGLDGPFWVLKNMLISSIIIYFLRYCFEKIKDSKWNALVCSVLIVIIGTTLRISPMITACLMGMFIAFYEHSGIETKTYFAFWSMALAMLLYILPHEIISAVFFCTLIIFVPRVQWVNNMLSSSVFCFLGRISWGIYSLHWPLYGSVGALLLVRLSGLISVKKAYGVTFLIMILLSLMLATIYFYTFEKLTSYILKKIDYYLKNELKR